MVFCPLCRFKEETGREQSGCREHGYAEARAAVRAEKVVLALVHRLKYSGERELAPLLAEFIVRAGIVDEDFASFNVMCPVPLFRTRERERGFNQSTEVARCIETASGVPLVTDLLARMQPTREQAKLPAELRRRNLLGSFAVTRPSLAAGKSVVLIDDVVTTGSTVAACIEALREAGVERVLVVSVAA
jgi:ComF family protein